MPPPHHTKLDLKMPILSVSVGGVLKFRLCPTLVARYSRIFRLIPARIYFTSGKKAKDTRTSGNQARNFAHAIRKSEFMPLSAVTTSRMFSYVFYWAVRQVVNVAIYRVFVSTGDPLCL